MGVCCTAELEAHSQKDVVIDSPSRKGSPHKGKRQLLKGTHAKENIFTPEIDISQQSLARCNSKARQEQLAWFVAKHKGPLLHLEIANENVSEKIPAMLTINAQGLVHMGRQAQDGITYFGFSAGNSQPPLNDVALPKKEGEEEREERHLMIYFDVHSCGFLIKDLNKGRGCFWRIEGDVELADESLLHLGTCFIKVQLKRKRAALGDHRQAREELVLKVAGDSTETFQFTPDFGGRIRVGRVT